MSRLDQVQKDLQTYDKSIDDQETTCRANPTNCDNANCPHELCFTGYSESALSGLWLGWACPLCKDQTFTKEESEESTNGN